MLSMEKLCLIDKFLLVKYAGELSFGLLVLHKLPVESKPQNLIGALWPSF